MSHSDSEEFSVRPDHALDPLIVALDIGTSSTRAIVFDRSGTSVAGLKSQVGYQASTTPDGGVQFDASTLFDFVCEAVDSICEQLRRVQRVPSLVACATFWHGLMGADTRGRALTPVFTWADRRGVEAANELRTRLNEDVIHGRTGARLHTSYWPAKLQWLYDTQRETFGRVAWWISFGEFLYLHLFGERRVSVSMASGTGLFDQIPCRWDPELIDMLPIREEQLSPLAEYSEGMYGLKPPFDARWPELQDVPWLLPVGDGACNSIGSGGVSDRQVVVMIGTSGAIRVVRSAPKVEIPQELWTYRVDGRRFVQGGAFAEGGNAFSWLRHQLQLPPGPELEQQLSSSKPDCHGLTVLPFLAGERSPNWNDRARACLLGMTLDTDAVEIVRAWLEAVTYRIADVYDVIRVAVPQAQSIIGSGAGLISSPAWIQILADVLGKDVRIPAVTEATSRGAALLALESAGILSDPRESEVPLREVIRSDREWSDVYAAARRRQRALYDVLIKSPDVPALWLDSVAKE